MSDDRAIYLIGPMGSGKTEVGRRLAEVLGWEFVDTDELVERREGRTVEAIFRESGEGYFREAEWQALRSLSGRRRLVVATGGGLFLGVDPRRFVREHGRSVWLDVGLDAARKRVGEGAGRPLWLPEDPLALRAFYDKRRAAYALAEARVDASTDDPDEVMRAILKRIPEIFD